MILIRFQMAVPASWSWMLGWLQCIAIAYQINYAIELWFTQIDKVEDWETIEQEIESKKH